MSRIFSIPAGIAFADALASGLLDRYRAEPLKLAECQILLPTRRACRTLKEAFLRQSGGKALLLPRMVPLGDIDADELALTAGVDIPPAIKPRRRQLLLAQLVARFNPDWLPAQHLAYARQLGRLFDDIAIENADINRLDDLAGELSQHWDITLRFLRPVFQAWPAILAEEQVLDSAVRRNRLLEAQAKAWTDNPPATPVIAAGLTGVIPAIATLVKAILALPQGEIVVPGLPLAAEAHGWWDKLDETHPHFGLRDLLSKLEIPLSSISLWGASDDASSPRRELLHTALLPAPATDSWANLPFLSADGITRVTCASEQEEATLIAYKLREVLETPGRTGTLVTTDRKLGHRVAQMLRRWGLGIDDSAGTPLSKTEPATFLRLLLAYAEQPDGHNFLALMKHPLMLAGVEPQECRARTRAIEMQFIRGYPRLAGIATLLRRMRDPDEQGKDAIQYAPWLEEINTHLAPLQQLVTQKTTTLTALLRELVLTAEALSAKERLWRAEAGEALADWVADLLDSARDYPPLTVAELSDVLLTLLSDVMVRLRYGDHPRLTLLGPMEARLQSADVMILAGLNETTWPALPEPDPWMSRPMRRAFGLKSPEQRLGEEAHDFYTLAATPEVILCRAERQEGAPSVPARWLRRLDTLLETLGLTAPFERGMHLLAEARLLDLTERVTPISPPAPCPPLAARPRDMWVTDIEKLRRDPYQVYAKLVLRLKALKDIEPDPNVAERGSFIHAVLNRFIEAHRDTLPADPLPLLMRLGEDELAKAGLEEQKALWWPRFVRAMDWFVQAERQVRAEGGGPLATETEGHFTLPSGFTIHAKADRIDYRDQGQSLAIIDYKTGTLPSERDRQAQVAVQLPLEGHIARHGGFTGIDGQRVSDLSFWKITGGNPPGLQQSAGKVPPEMMMDEAVAALEDLLTRFANPAQPYESEPIEALRPRYSDYRHLARTQEWASFSEEDEDDV